MFLVLSCIFSNLAQFKSIHIELQPEMIPFCGVNVGDQVSQVRFLLCWWNFLHHTVYGSNKFLQSKSFTHAEILTTNILNLDKQRTYVLLVEIQHLGEFLLAPVWYVFQMTAIFLVRGMPGNLFVLPWIWIWWSSPPHWEYSEQQLAHLGSHQCHDNKQSYHQVIVAPPCIQTPNREVSVDIMNRVRLQSVGQKQTPLN